MKEPSMRKLVLFACIALFGLTSLAAVNLPKTIKDIPIFPGAKVDADKNQGESTSKAEDSAAAYQDALASAKDQRDPDAIQAFEETIKDEYSDYYCDASPEEVVAWYLKKFGDVKNEEPVASSLEIGESTPVGILNLENYDEAKVFTRYQDSVDGPATYHDGALYKKILQGRAKSLYGWIDQLTLSWISREATFDYTTIYITIADQGFSRDKGKQSYKQRTGIWAEAVTVRRHSPMEMFAVKCGPDGWLAIDRMLKKLSSPDSVSLRRIVRIMNDADAGALASLVLEPLSERNILVPPSPNMMLDFDTLLRSWTPGTPIAIVPLLAFDTREALIKFYEAKTGKKAQSDGKGSMIFVLKGASMQTAEQAVMILPSAPGLKSTMVMVMKSRPGKP
jgi:hypothetical protein